MLQNTYLSIIESSKIKNLSSYPKSCFLDFANLTGGGQMMDKKHVIRHKKGRNSEELRPIK